MSLGGSVPKQHVVEFIRGTGVKTDGVTNAASTNGPWTWVVPLGVTELFVDACGAGGGGGGGTATGTSLGGGGGASSGIQFSRIRVSAVPGASLTVTVGAGGAGGAATNSVYAYASNGGNTLIEGLISPVFLFGVSSVSVSTELRLNGGLGGGANEAAAGYGGEARSWYPFASNSGSAGAPAATAPDGAKNAQFGTMTAGSGSVHAAGGGGGGGASTSGSTNGGSGGDHSDSGGYLFAVNGVYGSGGGSGNNTGTQSRGGGGAGGISIFANYPKGGNGGSAATTPSGYGAGGGGGGGGAAGANGCDGYVRLTYWAAD